MKYAQKTDQKNVSFSLIIVIEFILSVFHNSTVNAKESD